MFGEPMSSSAKWSGFNILRRILSTIQGWCMIECGFCLLYVRGRHISDLFFTDQCWQGQGGGQQRIGVVTVASVTMWFLRFAVLYRHNTHACWSAPAALLATAHSRR